MRCAINFSKVPGFKPATLLKLTLLHGCFSRFLNCTNGTKSRNAPHISAKPGIVMGFFSFYDKKIFNAIYFVKYLR